MQFCEHGDFDEGECPDCLEMAPASPPKPEGRTLYNPLKGEPCECTCGCRLQDCMFTRFASGNGVWTCKLCESGDHIGNGPILATTEAAGEGMREAGGPRDYNPIEILAGIARYLMDIPPVLRNQATEHAKSLAWQGIKDLGNHPAHPPAPAPQGLREAAQAKPCQNCDANAWSPDNGQWVCHYCRQPALNAASASVSPKGEPSNPSISSNGSPSSPEIPDNSLNEGNSASTGSL